MLATPDPSGRPLWLTGVRLFDGTGAPVRDGVGVLVEGATITRIGAASDAAPDGATVVDVAGATLLPGLIDAHAHVYGDPPVPAEGAEPVLPAVTDHVLAADLRATLRMGVTTLRDVGSYGDAVFAARQAMRYGAFRGPRLLTCGRIVSATAPGARSFPGMYREADGPDEIRKAVREQIRRGADFVKIMSTGARSVELEDPDPAQLTTAEIEAAVQEAHRLGYRVAAHAEGLAGTEAAIRAGVDTVEHGMYLHRRPDLLDTMAAAGQVLVPTLSCFYGVADTGSWAAPLIELARRNLDEADATLRAALAAGVPIALGHDWRPVADVAIEIVRMARHGMTSAEALRAATAGAAGALGVDDLVGAVTPGRLADLLVIDGDPVTDPEILRDPARIMLVVQGGDPVAGQLLDHPWRRRTPGGRDTG